MSDIIKVLSDSIANQIAAGEVIQRPASAVKELVENSIDAKANFIQINIKDAGRTLIQIVDNGKGMSEMDARMAFERHATSKISSAQDLFSLQTMGFRGEALASIAAVAQVELKTKRKEDEMGTLIRINGSQLETQEPIGTVDGSTFSIKNLFFNIPARRKFLKTNETEFKNIITEVERIALVNPEISFVLTHNDSEILNLPVSNTKQRIINIFGKKIGQQLIPINVETSLVKVSGFIGNPESAKKRGTHQYFFANGRYMRHPYFNRAVALAFEPFIPAGFTPNYFIYLEVNPSSIDVNIHPTKTEIKFENEQAIWQIISAAVKEAISVPGLEFDRDGAFEMPVYREDKPITSLPKIDLQSDYNPFKEHRTTNYKRTDWEQLYEHKQNVIPENIEPEMPPLFEEKQNKEEEEIKKDFLSFKGRYLFVTIKSGLTIINQRRAHIRILFDEYLNKINQQQGISQGMLFPEIISFTPKQATVLPCILDDFAFMGFDLSDLGNNSYSINGIPEGLDKVDIIELLQDMVDKVLDNGCEIKDEVSEVLALTLAKKVAIDSVKVLSEAETLDLISRLFSSSSPNYTPDGKIIISLISEEDINKRFS